MPVSTGVATGPVKALRNAQDKRIDKGDVLVACPTDPGWMPLFVNAGAAVIEVGGMLQHGAVIAREYGKPCVSGIDQWMTKLRDGQLVQVDGAAGVVRPLSDKKIGRLQEYSKRRFRKRLSPPGDIPC